ncbi:MAG: Twitching motility protein PilT, partial [Olavius algarvensis Gamma 1 endosymbiont]
MNIAELLAFSVEHNRLAPVDNSLIFINFMNRLRAKRTDSLTNRFFLLSI